MTESDVADFLLTHPDFFARHAELLGHIRLGNPHGSRAISLPERQIELLREKNRQYERRLSELVRYGHENDGLALKFDRWIAALLQEPDLTQLMRNACTSLGDIFDVPQVAARLWQMGEQTRRQLGHGHAAQSAHYLATAEMEQFTNGLAAPYCGPNKAFSAASWHSENRLSDVHAVEPVTESIALIPLRLPTPAGAKETFGLLVLGSPDPQRFQADMSTDFLTRIGTLASSALSRLLA